MDIEAGTINLSMRNAETGRLLTGNVYNVTFDDGTSRVMSIGQLVMALCLNRATEEEKEVVSMMDDMAKTTVRIEALSDIEEQVLSKAGDDTSATVNLQTLTGSWTVTNEDGDERTYTNAYQLLVDGFGISITSNPIADTAISSIESKLDECNTTSQEQMISLQSATNKRDQAYEMISNMMKSLYNVMSGIVSNT